MNFDLHHSNNEQSPIGIGLASPGRDLHSIVRLSMECLERLLKPSGIGISGDIPGVARNDNSYVDGLLRALNG
jgi:hypothetical protein